MSLMSFFSAGSSLETKGAELDAARGRPDASQLTTFKSCESGDMCNAKLNFRISLSRMRDPDYYRSTKRRKGIGCHADRQFRELLLHKAGEKLVG